MTSELSIFDTNIWISVYIPTDSTHKRAKEILYGHNAPFYLTQGIVAEVITVLKNKKQLLGAKTFVNMVYGGDSSFIVIPSSSYYQDTIDFFLNTNDTKLSFVDMSLVVLSKKYRIESFDKALNSAIQS